ncbi:MAG: succinate dehydrogenase assembly factor 2 [Methylococcaceae bacterium]|nr:MAG: succinate dehydrogenase assembly factor 2 [Methylococcaceae bacterium]
MSKTDKQLRWRCRRGSREMELMLMGYLEHGYQHAPAAVQTAFRRLLELPEDQLQRCLLGQQSGIDAELAALVQQIRTAFSAGA